MNLAGVCRLSPRIMRRHAVADEDHEQTFKDFDEAVNMTAAALEKWLDTDDSKAVGYKEEDCTADESVGHKSGHRIVAIKHKKKADLTDDDYAHMKKVVSYIHRHMAQGGPAEDMEHSRWRCSLMNWGHDPAKLGVRSSVRVIAPGPPSSIPRPARLRRFPQAIPPIASVAARRMPNTTLVRIYADRGSVERGMRAPPAHLATPLRGCPIASRDEGG